MTKRQFILHYFLLNKWSYLIAVACIFLVNWLQVEIPRYIQQAIDLLGKADPAARSNLNEYVMWVVAFSVVMVFVRILSRMYALNPGRITEATLKNDLFYRLNRLPNAYHQQFQSGKLISIINNDMNGIRLFYGIGFLQTVNVIFALSLTPIWMWRISPSLMLYSVIPVAVAFIAFNQGFLRMRKYQTERMQRLQRLSEQLMNYLSGIDLIKNQQMGPWVSDEVERVNTRLLDTIMRVTRIQTFILPLLDYANDLMKVVILGLGGYMVLQQGLTLGEMTAFLSYSALLALPLAQLGRIAVVYQMGMVSIESVQSILHAEIPETDRSLPEPGASAPAERTLSVRHLNYAYPGQDTLTLNDISFDIAPGEKVGVLGSIGAGKTTLVNCINHHLDVPEGHIFWGEDDVARMPRRQWRGTVRTITQEPYLFSDTVEANVRFGTDGQPIDKHQVNEVLALSQLSDDVSRFQDGDQTLVGEKGIMLSGGQKQRLSIARALLSPADLIIMDNVLSAVDYETERKILGGLFNRIGQQSVLVVSHRISALENLDKILVLHNGEIIARGTHEQLLDSSDYYRETWELQQHDVEESA
ncbi:ABC transporter ATP-binding protein [Saccharospirillum salsuginis]|uniref:ABC transporter ATP-binding protein n=1 Tax=Saccharospirillum salsuginis TaxID=418750 RepID=A0A918K8J5_9GAMM|nr:ABC transporter ATP-binding protein [Saccharospirillum salsuginis]GGX54602.1 ABC transporter ATP-binding protein [Saccharospirillum salsuginis]